MSALEFMVDGLTPESIVRPWVNAETDAAFVMKVEGTSRFIPLRFALPPKALPPLLKALHSPELTEGYDYQIKALVSDIFEISRYTIHPGEEP